MREMEPWWLALCRREKPTPCQLTFSGTYDFFLLSFFSSLCMLSRSGLVTPKRFWVIDALVSCWLTSWLHTLEEGMRYRWGSLWWGNHKRPGHTSSVLPLPFLSPYGSLPSTHTPCRLCGAKGRVACQRRNCDPVVNTLVLLWCLMGNLGVIWSWTVLSQEVSTTIVFWRGRAADGGVTCSVRLSVS